MTAYLVSALTYGSPHDVFGPLSALSAALNEWLRHFDYSVGTYAVSVSNTAPVSAQPRLTSAGSTMVGGGRSATYGDPAVLASSFGLSITGRAANAVGNLVLTVPWNYSDTLGQSLTLSLLEREIGHALGIRSMPPGYATGTVPGSPAGKTEVTVFELSARAVAGAVTPAAFEYGPNAQAAFGQPVPLAPDGSGTTYAGRSAANSTDPATTLQPLDIALLRDAGLPALTDQELGEHQVARLYVAAFGRTAESAGLIANYAGLRSGLTLAQLADTFVASPEFAGRYGTLSDAGFVDALYRNVLGRAGDAAGTAFYQGALARGASRGAILAGIADSDEERGRLNDNPNVTYAAAAEGQVARLYDTAFGRDADPGGFNVNVNALINGATLGQLAQGFLQSPEFLNLYGYATSDRALVTLLYAHTLKRAPDAAGADQYVRALGSGQFSQADLLASFSDSAEHIGLMAQRAGARDAAGYSIDLTPHLGIIPAFSAPLS